MSGALGCEGMERKRAEKSGREDPPATLVQKRDNGGESFMSHILKHRVRNIISASKCLLFRNCSRG